ncbi:alpha-amylase domain-containing protein [Acidisoma cladoniae]|uniref:alpha-amylase domain-containing protein n=1 Tax=Acidisoma cladoniae TaxID=3040935 RepID=UPI0025505081|nr:alpha-amylase domain-containing protein [Acidisoma sp. PAMC 29798]
MGVLLQGFFKTAEAQAVPAPSDGDPTILWWWDHLTTRANALGRAGFTAVWLPPVLKANGGAKPDADGYRPFDDYDIGSKDQMGALPTRFGSREALQRCVATLRANGLDVYLDLVEHHRSGDPGNFIFRYKGAEGRRDLGRFTKNPPNFVPNVPRDPNLGGPAKDDFPFARELAPINAIPAGYVSTGLIDAADWLTRALDVQGYRLDDVKGLSTDFLSPFLGAKAMAGKFAVGEFFDGDPTAVNVWVSNPDGMKSRASAFDFPLRFVLARMCRNPGAFDMATLDKAGLVGLAPLNAVTFVENHDTDLDDPIVVNKMLAYAYIMTSEGYPCVYWRDYSTDPDCYGLQPLLDNLIWIHEQLANGTTEARWKAFDLFVYERLGAPGLLVGLNNDPNSPHTAEVATTFGPNVKLHDYTGNGPDVVTTATGTAMITVPPNADGRGYVCYSRNGSGTSTVVTPRSVTQDFEGAADLDLPPADAARALQVGRIWCATGTPVQTHLSIPDLAATARATIDILGVDGSVLATATGQATLTTTTIATGFHALRISLTQAAVGTRPSYRLSATYTAPERPDLPSGAQTPERIGAWGERFDMPNAAIHAHLLPNGKVLFWGRRDSPVTGTLNDHFCTPHLWEPATGATAATPQPTRANGDTVNLFCSGHTMLADGTLLVIGGHLKDGYGINQACRYHFDTNLWEALPTVTNGRWYPTALTLADGRAVVLSGSFGTTDGKQTQNDPTPQVWDGTTWQNFDPFPGDGATPQSASPIDLFPCLHVAPDGRIFMSGPAARSFFLDPVTGTWSLLEGDGGLRDNARRDYAPSVMYDTGKIVYIGGGNNPTQPQTPSSAVEVIDLTADAPAWRTVHPMHFARRQHNATLLPDGTVLVTGGSQGPGFSDLTVGGPVHVAELWDPTTESWTLLAEEAVDRCYHATAVLLPDATVLSAGGGEFAVNAEPNPPQDTHRDGQVFKPPYLFRGPRPEISAAPKEIAYGAAFDISVAVPEDIGKVSLIRLASVTHTNNMNQRINILAFTVAAGGLRVTAPAQPHDCPPGYYMLFVLNRKGVPSVAWILHIAALLIRSTQKAAPAKPAVTLEEVDKHIRATASGTQVAVGLTSKCPYGLGACWGGAYQALVTLDGVTAVRPIANAEDSTADVYLESDSLPDIDRWAAQIAESANGSYDFRGVEVSITGLVQQQAEGLVLTGPLLSSAVKLLPLAGTNKIQFDRLVQQAREATPMEHAAFERLIASLVSATLMRVTGPLDRVKGEWLLHVRDFEIR